MKYKAYPEYKDSGVEWLGNIPTSWSVKKISYVALLQSGDAIVSEQIKSMGKYPVYGGNGLRGYSDKYNHEGHYILIGRQGALCGNINYGYKKFWASEHAVVVHPMVQLDTFFFGETLRAMNLNQYNVSAAQPGLAVANITCLKVPFPPLEEQKQIAAFLDRETAKIDTLIEKQQQLIKLLKEKRQAVIIHAVTKGLNPNAPMKDSGVEWLGDVPAHWKVKKLRYLGSCQNGINIGAEYFGSGYPFVSYGDVYKNEVLPKCGSGLVQSTQQDRETCSVLRGDVIFTRTSETIEEIGFSSTCLTTIKDASFAGFLIRFRPLENNLNPHFSKYYFRSELMRVFFIKEMNLVTRASLSQDLLKKLPVPLPSIDEQTQIAAFLEQKTKTIDKLISKAEQAIELIKERRTALISAAVTGKIDVRRGHE